MIRKLLLLSTALSSMAFANEDAKTYQSFDSDYNATLTVVPTAKSDFYYINYRGFEHSFDENTLFYKKTKNDLNDGYHFKLVGTPSSNFRSEGKKTLLSGSLYSYSEVFLDNDTVTKVIYTGTPDIVKINRIKEKYKNRQLEVVSKIAAKKLNKVTLKSLNDTCKTNIKISIDWDKFSELNLKTSPAKLSAYMRSLVKVCQIDSDYLEAVQMITKIDVSPSIDPSTHNAKLSNTSLHIEIGSDVHNLPETSYKLIYEIF